MFFFIFLFVKFLFAQNSISQCPTYCKPGTYFPDDESKIKRNEFGLYSYRQEECESGYYCPGDGTRRECEDGYFSEPGSEECLKCGCMDGSICQKKTVVNETMNEIIQAGHCFNNVLCRAGYGYYDDEDDHKICYPCWRNRYSPGNDSTCLKCPEHSLPNADHSKCERCPIGSELKWGECLQCKEGHFYDTITMECKLCPDGTHQPNEGQTFCIPCPEGLYPVSTRKWCTTKEEVERWENRIIFNDDPPKYHKLPIDFNNIFFSYDKDEENNKSVEL